MNSNTVTTPALNNFTVQIQCSITEQRVADLLCSAFEGGSNYWYQISGFTPPVRETFRYDGEESYRYIDYPLNEGGAVAICDVEGEDKKEYRLDRNALEKGLAVMAEKYPNHFADFRNENDDAETADVFLQCCLFGDVVYG